MSSRSEWLDLADKATPDDFPFSLNADEAIALLPFFLALKPANDELDSLTYDQLRDANLPHSLKMAG